MNRRRLAEIFSLNEATEGSGDADRVLSNHLPVPTIDARAALYLRATHENHDFTQEEHTAARNLILDAMAANIVAKSEAHLPEELTSTDQAGTAPFANITKLASRETVSLAYVTRGADATSSPSQIVPFSRPSRRLAPRKVFAGVAIAAVAACFLVIAIPTYWFTANPNPVESKVAVESSQQQFEMSASFPAAPKKVETMAAPHDETRTLTENDPLIRELELLQRNQTDTQETANLLKRGRELVAARDILAARSVLKRAAEAGDASAALELGGTYDPVVLERLKVQMQSVEGSIAEKSARDSNLTIASDVAMARAWYQRAKELGSAEALKRLERLPGVER
jgi:hypothetical protein